MLEHYSHTRWWDYLTANGTWMGTSAFRLLSGCPGLGNRQWLVPLLMRLYQLVPAGLAHVLLWIFAILLVIDLGTTLTCQCATNTQSGQGQPPCQPDAADGLWIFDRTERRMHTRPAAGLISAHRTVFAAGCSFKIML
ncbi:MAG: putative ABC transporter permease [Subdoligranulum sp.]